MKMITFKKVIGVLLILSIMASIMLQPAMAKSYGTLANIDRVRALGETIEDWEEKEYDFAMDDDELIAIKDTEYFDGAFLFKEEEGDDEDNKKVLEEYTPEIILVNGLSYDFFADKDLLIPMDKDEVIKLNNCLLTFFIRVVFGEGEDDFQVFMMEIFAKRKPVIYEDIAKIPDWALESLMKLNEGGTGIFVGDDKGNFNPTKNMSRYEIAVVATKLVAVNADVFSIVTLNVEDEIVAWAEPYVKAVVFLGIMSGNLRDGKVYFDGSKATQRQQFAKIILESILLIQTRGEELGETSIDYIYALNKEDVDTIFNGYNFRDVDSIQDWAISSVKLCVAEGILSGSKREDGIYIKGNALIKRQEAVVMLSKLALI